ncbi:MAG: FAD-dependent oxidoreductase [Actinomycetota bacterium]|nr:FAD-dependent oxidoreductase [Actinomycetota bacterium]
MSTATSGPKARLHDVSGAAFIPRVVVVGGGFPGLYALGYLRRLLAPSQAELVLVAPADYLLYSPLLPDVATGTLNPRDIAVSLRQTLRGVRPVFGHATEVDLGARTVNVRGQNGDTATERWDRMILAPGSVTRQFHIPGLAEHGHGLKTIEEALFLRDHVLAQLDLADSLPATDAGRAERQERLTVVSVGAGYIGTEFIAQMQHWTQTIAERWDSFKVAETKWLLVDLADQILPELGARVAHDAARLLTERGIEIRLGTTVAMASATSVTLTDGSVIPTRTLVWSAGVSPSPLIATLGLPTEHGRLVVDAELAVPGATHVWAAGDAAAVPDLVQRRRGNAARSSEP